MKRKNMLHAVLMAFACCSPLTAQPTALTTQQSTSLSSTATTHAVQRPKLVVGIVVDQMVGTIFIATKTATLRGI